MASTPKSKQQPTLKGLFSVPKINHGRDFLRENKLNLRDLQRVSTENKEAQQKEQQRLLRYLPPQQQALIQQQQQQQQRQQRKPRTCISRRSASETRTPVVSSVQQSKQNPMAGMGTVLQQRKSVTERLPINHRKGANDRNSKIDNRDTITGKYASEYGRGLPSAKSCPTCGSCGSSRGSLLSRVDSCDKQIQTEGIYDEKFLYDCLQRCGASDLNQAQHLKNTLQRENSAPSAAECRSRGRQSINEGGDQISQYNQQQRQQQNCADDNFSVRSKSTMLSRRGSDMAPCSEAELVNSFEAGDFMNESDEKPLQQSVLSHRTVLSTQTHDSKFSLAKKRSTASVQKSGCREDVRQPRCSEYEKHEKSLLHEREMDRDPDCSTEEYQLSEEERCSNIDIRDKQFKTLIDELNQMPVTSQTLRTRTRKAEIEKELTQLENEMKVYSQPKPKKMQNIQKK